MCSSRPAAAILAEECSYIDPQIGGPGARVGVWFGGGRAPPLGVIVGGVSGAAGPPFLLRMPRKRFDGQRWVMGE